MKKLSILMLMIFLSGCMGAGLQQSEQAKAEFGSYYNAAITPAADDIILLADASNSNAVEGVHIEDIVRSSKSIVVAASNSYHQNADYVCDGTDDQVQIQAAIDALRSTTGCVYLLAGQYNITSDIILYCGVGLVGEMPGWDADVGTVLVATSGITNAIIDVVQNPYNPSTQYFPYLANLGVHGYSAVTSVRVGIAGTNEEIWDIFIDNVLVLGGLYGFDLKGKVHMRDCYAEICTTGIHTTGSLISIDSCYIFGNFDYGIEFSRGNEPDTGVLKITNNTIRGNKKNNIRFYDMASDALISHNFIGSAGESGATADDIYLFNVNRVQVVNNKFVAGDYSESAIKIGDARTREVIIANNVFKDYSKAIEAGWHVRLSRDAMRIYDKHSDHFQDCLAASTTHIHTAITGTGAEQEITTSITNPDIPRNISITNSANSTGVVTVEGIDAKGDTAWDDITIVTGGTAYGVVAFSTITKIIVPDTVANPDTISVGISDKLGLSNVVYETGDVYKIKINNADATVGAVDYTNATVDCGTISAGNDITIYYRSNLNVID